MDSANNIKVPNMICMVGTSFLFDSKSWLEFLHDFLPYIKDRFMLFKVELIFLWRRSSDNRGWWVKEIKILNFVNGQSGHNINNNIIVW